MEGKRYRIRVEIRDNDTNAIVAETAFLVSPRTFAFAEKYAIGAWIQQKLSKE